MREARLYEVRSPRGDSIYSIYDPQAQWVWTERSELAVRQIAREKGFQLVDGGVITHAQMLALIGPDVAPTAAPAPAKLDEKQKPADPPPAESSPVTVGAATEAPPPAVSLPPVVYHWDDELPVDAIALKPALLEVADLAAVHPRKNVFQSERSVEQPKSAANGQV